MTVKKLAHCSITDKFLCIYKNINAKKQKKQKHVILLFKTDEKISKLGNRLFYKVVKATGELYMLWPLDGGNRQNTEGNETNVIILSIMFYALFVCKALLTDQWNKKSLCITHLSSHLALCAYTMCSSLCLLYSSRTHRPHR